MNNLLPSGSIAARIAANPDTLISRREAEVHFGLSARWLELAAHKGEGPPMVKISRRMVRYRASDVNRWLESRTIASDDCEGAS